MLEIRTDAPQRALAVLRAQLEPWRVSPFGERLHVIVDDAAEAVRLGAWAIGLVHYGKSVRHVPPADAAAIAAAFRRKCEVVGVFANPDLDEVAKAVEDEGLTMVQLCAAEGPSFCAEVARRTGVKVIKSIHVSPELAY